MSEWEASEFGPWMEGEELIVSREVVYDSNQDDFDISVCSYQSKPTTDWLNVDKINGSNIDEWWGDKEQLKIEDKDFTKLLGGSKPLVGEWKDKAKEFVKENRDLIDFEFEKIPNPKGYSGVLSGTLPEFIYVPAVKDVLDEAKVQKTNPFGTVINSILENIGEAQKKKVEERIEEVKSLFKKGSEERIGEIDKIEKRLNQLVSELIDCKIELDIGLPELDVIFTDTKILADDGVQTAIDMKGHGLQRTMIFTILRAYVELVHVEKAGNRAKERSTIFAFEEPELYLHPQFQRTLFSVFRDISSGNDQVLYSTQSNLFVDIAYFDEIAILRRKEVDDDFFTVCKQLKIKDLLDDLKERKGVDGTEEGIREQYFNVFNPFINEGFFADKVIIVEGDSELYSLPIYSKALNYDFNRNNISVVHSDGKGPIDRILRIFNGFEIPTFVWIDGDKKSTKEAVTNKTLELMSLHDEELSDINELETFVNSNLAVLKSTYEEELKNKMEDYDEIIKKAVDKLGPTGKPLKHRFLANTIVKKSEEPEEDIHDLIPEFLQEIISNIKDLDYQGSILKHG